MKLIKAIQKVAFLTAIAFSALLKNGNAQFVNNGASVTVTAGATLYADASVTNNVNGVITNNGSIITDSSIINGTGASLSGNGNYVMQSSFTNTGIYDAGTSVLQFTGSGNSAIKNKSGNIYTLLVSKDVNKYINVLDKEKVLNSVVFMSDNNWIKLGRSTLTLAANCTVVDYSDKRYFVTNDTGFLKKESITNAAFTFPVGFDKSTYNPITIKEGGAADDYSVRCLEYAMLNGSSGDTISTGGINVSWIINEATAGGANATITAKWKSTDQLASFNYYKCRLVRYTGVKWDFNGNLEDTADGSTYRTISRSGLSSFGYFTVLSSANPSFTNTISSPQNNAFAGIEKDNLQMKVYPTIVQNNINIEVPAIGKGFQKMNISVIDGSGRMVWQKQHADYASQRIFLPALPSGMYNVLVEFGNNRFVQKIIIGK